MATRDRLTREMGRIPGPRKSVEQVSEEKRGIYFSFLSPNGIHVGCEFRKIRDAREIRLSTGKVERAREHRVRENGVGEPRDDIRFRGEG